MDTLNELMGGFAAAMTWQNLIFAFLGCLLGTIIGVLPGIGPVAGVALLIPLTMNLDATGAIIMLCAIFYGTAYGGTITSVLLNTPGEAASAITTIDGYAMTKIGKAGAALTIAAVGSFVGGTIATLGLVAAAKPLGEMGLLVGPPEFFALMVVGISLLVALAGKSMVKALISGALGLLISMIGIDPVAGAPRFTFGSDNLLDGVSFVAVIVGVFGLSEILSYRKDTSTSVVHAPGLRSLLPNRTEWRRSTPSMARGTGIGFGLGLIPGMTGSVSSLLAYGAEKKFSKYRNELGKGAIEGVAGPETANNAHANAALIPLFTLGIPASPTIAVLMGAFLQQGLTPGPTLFTEHSEIAWAIIASLFIGNLLLLLLNVPLVGLWTSILRVPAPILTALILLFMVIGAYTINFNVFDVFVMIAFGLLGLALRHLDIPLAPMVLTLVLGPLMERSLRESLEISQGDFGIFLNRPISVVLIGIGLLIVLSPLLKLRKPKALTEDPET
ncbi:MULTISPECIES: tripartite tricarboxylate transporter permease [Paenarthrobacter]|uniref:tripartite tricarboxylate transporter permease n=1 Tax=Paenarthrobacter TaxID=1742992 RepID=UPI0011A9E64C|nr:MULTISPECIES: tripartite tricarboxylate transporter permease [Paenarthrobacter]MDD7834226.1 tripartite tricarboxylate transporter permease [Paenarthrobacter sp. AB444]MDP9935583.1 putative tricarboxylic transport membrane protein [Paenarthrobacter nicotinovorans]UXM91629.1 tripartite tricarboxylate transporter permease [Paenarthrobacter sp. JL.01a]